ncbi:MAG TPA: hypothetical protein PL005_04215, partial [Candidatus Hydrogenedentes bacterium]|nr:hypothetical protein [Candidatus Hydrogenedentota bacterium]
MRAPGWLWLVFGAAAVWAGGGTAAAQAPAADGAAAEEAPRILDTVQLLVNGSFEEAGADAAAAPRGWSAEAAAEGGRI